MEDLISHNNIKELKYEYIVKVIVNGELNSSINLSPSPPSAGGW
jgi:hypothetical protein